MTKPEAQEILLAFGAPGEERFRGIDAVLEASAEASLLLMGTEEGTFVNSHSPSEKPDEIVPLVMVAVIYLIEQWRKQVGESGAERLFAMFVTSVAEKMGWGKSRASRRGN